MTKFVAKRFQLLVHPTIDSRSVFSTTYQWNIELPTWTKVSQFVDSNEV